MPVTVVRSKLILFKIVNDCWEVTNYKPNKSKQSVGYYSIRFSGIKEYLHRAIYLDSVGNIPAGKVIRHSCNNKLCINRKHLLLGSYQANSNDAIRDNVFTHKICRNGHDLTLPNAVRLQLRKGRRPHNVCLECENNRKLT